jgi:hypothetical protein
MPRDAKGCQGMPRESQGRQMRIEDDDDYEIEDDYEGASNGLGGRWRFWFCGWNRLVVGPGRAFGLGRKRFGRIAICICLGELRRCYEIGPRR